MEPIVISRRMSQAINLAAIWHQCWPKKPENATDRSGVPYLAHPFRVALSVLHLGEDAFIAAVLHDTIEDTEATLSEIQLKFGPEVTRLVSIVTRWEPDTATQLGEVISVKEKYHAEFIRRCALDPVARAIKRADIIDNLRPERFETLSESAEVKRGMQKRYLDALEMLQD